MNKIGSGNVTKLLRVLYRKPGCYSVQEVYELYNQMYPPETISREAINWLTRKASIRYRISVLVKEGYLDKKPVIPNEGKAKFKYEVSAIGRCYCALNFKK